MFASIVEIKVRRFRSLLGLSVVVHSPNYLTRDKYVNNYLSCCIYLKSYSYDLLSLVCLLSCMTH